MPPPKKCSRDSPPRAAGIGAAASIASVCQLLSSSHASGAASASASRPASPSRAPASSARSDSVQSALATRASARADRTTKPSPSSRAADRFAPRARARAPRSTVAAAPTSLKLPSTASHQRTIDGDQNSSRSGAVAAAAAVSPSPTVAHVRLHALRSHAKLCTAPSVVFADARARTHASSRRASAMACSTAKKEGVHA